MDKDYNVTETQMERQATQLFFAAYLKDVSQGEEMWGNKETLAFAIILGEK